MDLNVISLQEQENKTLVYTAAASIVKITVPKNSDGFGLIIKNADASSSVMVKIKAGNSIYALGDLSATVPKNSDMLFNLRDTGRFKNVSGEDAGRIVINLSGTSINNVSLSAFEL